MRELTVDDLKILADFRIYLILAPFVGGVLAMVLYIIFLSGLLQGDLFPKFMPLNAEDAGTAEGFLSILNQQAEDYTVYAKLMFWGRRLLREVCYRRHQQIRGAVCEDDQVSLASFETSLESILPLMGLRANIPPKSSTIPSTKSSVLFSMPAVCFFDIQRLQADDWDGRGFKGALA